MFLCFVPLSRHGFWLLRLRVVVSRICKGDGGWGSVGISGDVAYDCSRVFLAGHFGFFGSSASRTEPYIFCLRVLRRAASLLKN